MMEQPDIRKMGAKDFARYMVLDTAGLIVWAVLVRKGRWLVVATWAIASVYTFGRLKKEKRFAEEFPK